MAWYREADYPNIPAYNRSFIVALSNLIQHLDAGEHTPDVLNNLLTSDDPYLDWLVLPEYVKTVTLKEVHDDDPQWPIQNDAIVKFRRTDFESGNELDHYCLVIDAKQMAIVDSLDGIIKHGASYGQVYSWATYTKTPPPKKDELTLAIEEKRAIIVGKGENIWDVAREINQKVAVLMEYNGIGDPRKVKEGYVINIPPTEYVEKRTVEYRMFDEPLTMKVIKPGGTQKYAFGNAKKWLDVHPVGRTHAENSVHVIAGEARVFLEDEEDDIEAAYYMERIDMGRYRDTGLVTFMTGFNHSHLAEESEIVETVNEPLEMIEHPVEPQEVPQPIVKDPAVIPVEEKEPESIIETPPPDTFRPSVELLEEDGSANTYMVNEDVYVNELSGKRAPKLLKRNQLISLTYRKEIRDLVYGLPGVPFDDFGLVFLVPLNKVTKEDDLFDATLTMAEKRLVGSPLSFDERAFALLSNFMSKSVKLRAYLNRKK